jgi:enoyl-CoA hydratase/carnithine racemase
VTIDNARRRNAMGRNMRQNFRDAVAGALAAADECRAVVITGAGAHFSAGADISEMSKRTLTQTREIMEEGTQVVRSIVGGSKPVIAAIEGVAFGAGFSLACAADYVVASSESRFCAAFIRIGLIPDTGILWTLPQKVGPAKARELLALASEIDAAEALRIGLVEQLVEPGQALGAAIALGAKLARNPPLGMALIKAALTSGNATMDDSLNTEIDYQPLLRRSVDHQEAARAFVEKRKPVLTAQ